ncbi:MAG: UvrD-helicase domain-containing protein [Bilophila wadsworthia]
MTGRYRSSSLLDALPEAQKPGRKPKAAPSKEPASKQVSLFAAMTPPAPQTPPDPKAFPYSEAQQKAIQAGPNPVLVLAGPGSGKTRTLVGRVQRLLKDGIPAQRILAVTFTRRAAAELRERLERALGEGVPLPQADTLHALALSHWGLAEEALPAVKLRRNGPGVFAKANALSAADARRAG